MFTLRMKLLLVILSIGMFSCSEKFMSFDYFADNDEIVVDERQQMINEFEEVLDKLTGMSWKCLGEVLNLKGVITNLKNAQFNLEALYKATFELVGRFPALKETCGLNDLPKIDLTKWTQDKFAKSGCTKLIGVLVTEAKECMTGSFDRCSKILPQVKIVGDCFKNIF